MYLVSVYRARSGNIHRAVGQDFVLNADDILYFTGMVKEFAQFCEKNGLEVITNEVDIVKREKDVYVNSADSQADMHEERQTVVKFASTVQIGGDEVEDNDIEMPPTTILENCRHSYFSKEAEKMQEINRLTGDSFLLCHHSREEVILALFFSLMLCSTCSNHFQI